MSGEAVAREIAVGARTRRVRWRGSVVAAALVVVLAGAGWYGAEWWRVGRFVETTDDAYVGGDVTPIAPHVSGFVARILVADNQYVRAGETLVLLDQRDFAAGAAHAAAVLRQREAGLADLEAREAMQRSVIAEQAAGLAGKEADAAFAAEDAARYGRLARANAASRQDAERAEAGTRAAEDVVAAARAGLAAARGEFAVLQSEVGAAKAAIAAAGAELRQARLDLGYTRIEAPIAGYVGDRYAEVGAYVTAGTDLLSIVPARGLWVDANFKEDQLARMKPGDRATIVADVLPGRVFRGHVLSLAPATGAVFSVIPAQNATGNFTKIVQRVPVRIGFDGAGGVLGLLRPGLSTNVSVATRSGVDP